MKMCCSGKATNTNCIVFALATDIPVNLTIDRLLFGSPDPRDDQNNTLFLNVQSCIVNSKRFP